MIQPVFRTSYANPVFFQSQNRTGQIQKPVSGETFYGADGENLIPDVNDLPKDGTSKTTDRDPNDRNRFDRNECQTCENRKYKDGSDDPGVSFKTPTNIRPENASSAVRGHEGEHVVRERAKADREDRKVVSQSVTYHTAICPECGTPYISGGTTQTVTKANPEQERLAARFQVGMNIEEKGRFFDMTA